MTQNLFSIAFLSLLFSPAWSQDVQWTADSFPGTTIHRNLDYLPDADYPNQKDKLDIFLPENQEKVPIIFFLHGGALRMGDKSYGEKFAARMVGLGYGVVSPNYRLSPAVQHPAHVEDAAAALAWTLKGLAFLFSLILFLPLSPLQKSFYFGCLPCIEACPGEERGDILSGYFIGI